MEVIPHSDRLVISRLRNCIAALAQCKMMIFDTSTMYAYDASVRAGFEVSDEIKFNRTMYLRAWYNIAHALQVKDLLLPENIREIGLMVRKQFEMEVD